MIQYFAENLWQMWAIVAVICLILELMNGDFFIMCFAIGGVCAAICAALGANFYWQMGIFALFTLISLFLVRPFALRYLHRNDEARPSNADALIGRKGKVIEAIEADGFGRVAIDGDVWKAVSVGGVAIPRGAQVRVKSMESITVTVEEIQ
ncbi:MAG: NfeD family protein [Prevotella sp.]|nr:NfeD family protein [Prevotella sp.]